MTIGTKFAPPYCSTFYGSFRGKGLSKVKRNRMFGGGKLMIYFLFGNMVKRKELINEINSFHPTIKFTADWSKEKVNFLDVEVTLNNGVLSTDLFVKPTDTHQFLDPTSCHHYHCKKATPYSQTLKLKICSDNSNFDKRCNELESWSFGKG